MTLEFHYSLPVHSFFEVYSFSALCQDSEKGAIHAIMGMLSSSVKPWHCAAAELIGRLIINPDNEPFLLPIIPQVNVFLEFDHSNKGICFSDLLVSYLRWFT